MTVSLRPADTSDIPFIMACERRPDYEHFVGRWPEEKHRAVMADKEFRYLLASDAGGPLGFAILHETWLRPQNLYLKRIAVHDAGKGHGKHVLAALTDHVFAETPAHRFWLEVVEANPRARHVYRTLGWVEEGIVREAFEDNGARGSFVQMSILKSDWRKGARPPLVFNQATVTARDLERSIAFYRMLGFHLIVKSPHYARFEIGDGRSTFSLHVGETEGAANGPHLYFECIDLDARVAELEAKGIVFDSQPVDQTWLWREAWLSDPAGNRLCLYWAGENRRFPPWRLKD
jgi:catechol 2,3-dioxygenase-like lactoylglutathione lyase family enzyme/ribosomal protein S18 acetylase RimI-like enzyme